MPELETIPFNKRDINGYLDRCIKYWRVKRDKENDPVAKYYIDAFQSVRTTLFGKTLPLAE